MHRLLLLSLFAILGLQCIKAVNNHDEDRETTEDVQHTPTNPSDNLKPSIENIIKQPVKLRADAPPFQPSAKPNTNTIWYSFTNSAQQLRILRKLLYERMHWTARNPWLSYRASSSFFHSQSEIASIRDKIDKSWANYDPSSNQIPSESAVTSVLYRKHQELKKMAQYLLASSDPYTGIASDVFYAIRYLESIYKETPVIFGDI